jgi:hypothetical protein
MNAMRGVESNRGGFGGFVWLFAQRITPRYCIAGFQADWIAPKLSRENPTDDGFLPVVGGFRLGFCPQVTGL